MADAKSSPLEFSLCQLQNQSCCGCHPQSARTALLQPALDWCVPLSPQLLGASLLAPLV